MQLSSPADTARRRLGIEVDIDIDIRCAQTMAMVMAMEQDEDSLLCNERAAPLTSPGAKQGTEWTSAGCLMPSRTLAAIPTQTLGF